MPGSCECCEQLFRHRWVEGGRAVDFAFSLLFSWLRPWSDKRPATPRPRMPRQGASRCLAYPCVLLSRGDARSRRRGLRTGAQDSLGGYVLRSVSGLPAFFRCLDPLDKARRGARLRPVFWTAAAGPRSGYRPLGVGEGHGTAQRDTAAQGRPVAVASLLPLSFARSTRRPCPTPASALWSTRQIYGAEAQGTLASSARQFQLRRGRASSRLSHVPGPRKVDLSFAVQGCSSPSLQNPQLCCD